MTLREILKVRRVSQLALSKRTGLSVAAINRAVNGDPIQKTTLTVICAALEIQPDEIKDINVYKGAAPGRYQKRV